MDQFLEPLALAAYSGATAILFQYLNAAQPEPYMDEIFHIPQAQKYCQGNFREVSNSLVTEVVARPSDLSSSSSLFLLFFQWDPKLTTLPGLYLISVGILHPVSKFFDQIVCESVHLRLINVVLSLITLLIIVRISEQIHGGKHVRKKSFNSFIVKSQSFM